MKILQTLSKIFLSILLVIITSMSAMAQELLRATAVPTPIPATNWFTFTYNGKTYTYSGLNCAKDNSSCQGWSSNSAGNSSDFLPLFLQALRNGGFASMVSPAGCSNYLSIQIHTNCTNTYCWEGAIYQQRDDPRSSRCLASFVRSCPVGCRDGQCFSETPRITCSVQNMGPSDNSGHYRIRWRANITASSPHNSLCVDEASCCPNYDPSLPQPCRLNWLNPGDFDAIYGSDRTYEYNLATAGNTYTRTVRFSYYGTISAESCSITIPASTPTPAPTPTVASTATAGSSIKGVLIIQ